MSRLELDWARRMFHRAPEVTVTEAQGVVSPGRGTVVPVKKEEDPSGDRRHPLGTLSRPLYRFTGWLAAGEDCLGARLTQGERAYRVLACRPVTLGTKVLCLRCLLEREEAAS